MEKRKHRISNKKLRGEWAEMRFMVCATEREVQVSRPWGESRSYDFVVGRPGSFVAVQVKSTVFELEQGWICKVRSGNKPYPRGSFDFLAAYIVFEDAWYIIPENEVQGMENITLHTGSGRANYENYREAWHLLDPGPASGTIDSIHACIEESSAATEKICISDRGPTFVRAIVPRFSSAFHREVSSSTVSAQGENVFLLRLAMFCRRVGSAHT